MALQRCRDCGNQLSTEAITCPHCGAPDPLGLRRAKIAQLQEKTARDARRGLNVAGGIVAGAVVIAILAAIISIISSASTSEPKVPATVELPDAVAVSFVPSRVAFDWNTGETEIRGILAKPPGSAAPDTVWVWAYFVNPTGSPAVP